MSPKIFILSVIALFVYNIPEMLTAAKTPTHVGCYRTTRVGLRVGGALSIEHCLSKCQKLGYRYAGIFKSGFCSCGDLVYRFRPSSRCSMKCISQQKPCGGRGATSIYKVSKLPASYKQEGYLGCYKENKSNRVMSRRRGEVTSAWACTKKCNKAGKMKYAGLIANGKYTMCYCGTSYEKYGKSTKCNKKCRSGEICGGKSSLSVFKLLEPFERGEPIGCFKEGSRRKLSKKIGYVLSVRHCLDRCFDHKYLALQNGRDCYCGNDYPKSSTSNQCKKRCRHGMICGGRSAISVFKVVLMDV